MHLSPPAPLPAAPPIPLARHRRAVIHDALDRRSEARRILSVSVLLPRVRS